MRTKEQFIKEQLEWLNKNGSIIESGYYSISFYGFNILEFTKVNNEWTHIN